MSDLPALRRAALATSVFVLLSCGPPASITVTSPVHGTFLNGTLVTVTGTAQKPGSFTSFTANGVPITPGTFWTVDVPVDPAEVFNRITVEAVSGGKTLRESFVVVVGDGVNTGFVTDGQASPDAASLRIEETGLDQISPIVESLSAGALDITDLIAGQNPIATGNFGGIVSYAASVVEVGFAGFGLEAETGPSGLDATITIDDFFLEIDLDLDWLGSCTLEVTTATTTIEGAFDLEPLLSDPSFVDVNQVGGIDVILGGFGSQFVGGICDDPVIGDIINSILGAGEIQTLMEDGFESNLNDPDGAGPLDSALAAGIQDALAGISISGPVGQALNAQVDAAFTSVTEDATGVTLLTDTAIYTTGPAPGAPDLPASYEVFEPVPSFGPTTPVGGLPYGLAFGISTSALNQLIKTQIENGLLQSTITEFGGIPLTASLLSIFIPELIPEGARPVEIEIAPTIAPVFTGAAGPMGEFALMKIAGLGVTLVFADTDESFLTLEVDLDAGLDLAFTAAGLEFTLAAVTAPGAVEITVVDNPLGSNEASLQSVFAQLFPLFAPELENAIEAFPVPSLLGLDLDPVELARLPGGNIGLFANLVPTPTSTFANMLLTDLSTLDFRQQGGCWLREWRHRLSGSQFGPEISANLRGMLGADAGCTTNDASSHAVARYQLSFDVIGVAGEQWTVDIDHAISGALNRISDGYNDGIGFQDGGGHARFDTPVRGSWSLDGSPATAFDFTPSTTSINDGIGGSSSNQDVGFTGSNGATIVGTGNGHFDLIFEFELDAFSNSNTAFPTANGDEMAIRLGKNDTIDNNFTAGSYPGMGNRNIAEDGHFVTVELTTAPAP
ncbi:MAG: hypothetical protein QNK05_23935 [Myxococcota bacterium]|nr:hypothetical protein [Myxococcota bacterium]